MTEPNDNLEHLKRMLDNYQQRLQTLKEQRAFYGNSNVPPYIVADIKDAEQGILDTQSLIQKQQQSLKDIVNTSENITFQAKMQILAELMEFVERLEVEDEKDKAIFMPFFEEKLQLLLKVSNLHTLHYLMAKCLYYQKEYGRSEVQVHRAMESDERNLEYIQLLVNSLYQQAIQDFISSKDGEDLETGDRIKSLLHAKDKIQSAKKFLEGQSSYIRPEYLREMRYKIRYTTDEINSLQLILDERSANEKEILRKYRQEILDRENERRKIEEYHRKEQADIQKEHLERQFNELNQYPPNDEVS